MIKNKFIVCLISFLIIITFSNLALASNMSVFTIPHTNSKDTYTYKNNILSEFKISDNGDRITEIELRIDNSDYSKNTGILINFSENFTYTVTTNKFTWYFIPYQDVTQTLTFQNYTVFNQTSEDINIIPTNLIVNIKYNLITGKTTFREIHTTSFNGSVYEDNRYLGMPSPDIKVNGITQYDAIITINNIGSESGIIAKKNKLSALSGFIYNIFTLKIPLVNIQILGDNDTILNILLILDIFFFIIYLIVTLLFTYPYLVLIYILIIGNIFVSYKSNSIREFAFNFQVYYSFIGNKIYSIATAIIPYIIRLISGLINAITNLIP